MKSTLKTRLSRSWNESWSHGRAGRIAFAACLTGLLLSQALPSRAASLTAEVNPFVGTAGGGNTYPGAVAPFGMVQFSPDTNRPSIGYDYGAPRILGFSMTHMSGVGCNDYGDVFLTASTGPVKTAEEDYASPFGHQHESASPGYYSVLLDRWNVRAELTASTHAGLIRFSFPAGQQGNILIPISRTLTRSTHASVTVLNNREIQGSVTSQDFCGASPTYTVYFVMQFDRPFASSGTWSNGTATDGAREATQPDDKTDIGAYVSYPASTAPAPVLVRIGISFVDLSGARINLDREVADRSFDEIHARTAQDWERELSKIQVRGGTPEQRRVFYTALYHCLLMPNVFSDVDGRYVGYDHQVHFTEPGRQMYANYSGWDIYRNEATLLSLLEPQRMQDIAQSAVLMYQQMGFFDRWPQANTPTGVMVGSPITSILVTAWNAGLHQFNIQAGYTGMMKEATDYASRHIDPLGYDTGSPSVQEEYAYADAALSYLAGELGQSLDEARLQRWALSYKNLYNPATGFIQPRLADGHWRTPFDPTSGDDYVEGSAWQYLWLAPQDVRGLIALMGGDATFNERLDSFFDYPHPEWNGRYYNPYNEPDLQAPFLYDYSGAPWKTQARVRELQRDVYRNAPDGIPGNDDCGTMSAWYILSAMGLYPVDPGRPALELCSPLFPEVKMRLESPHPGHEFTMQAPNANAENAYIQSVTVNGQPEPRPWIDERVILNGGTLQFNLGAAPDRDWGAAPGLRPPSLTS